MNKPVPISAAAAALGVSTSTLRRWDITGKLTPARTEGGQRRYNLAELRPGVPHVQSAARKSIAYARVSSQNQKADLERQKQVLELYCASQGWTFEVIADVGSGVNYQKKGLKNLVEEILAGQVRRLVLTHKDRLLRFGAELVFAICEAKQVDVVLINQSDDSTFEDDLAGDMLEMIRIFSGRPIGARSHKNQKLIDTVRSAVKDAQ